MDLSNTTEFALQRYNGVVDFVKANLSAAGEPFPSRQGKFAMSPIDADLLDQTKVCEPRDWLKVQSGIRKLITENEKLPKTSRNPTTTRLLTQIIPLPRTLANLVVRFEGAVHPSVPDVNIIWGMTDLIIKASRWLIVCGI